MTGFRCLMKKPDFFIVGGPKCGTTALYVYLRDHPAIFMPAVKEPHFFCPEFFGHKGVVSDLQEYLQLFRHAGPEHRAVGEASALYLASKSSLSLIRDFNPSARIVVMVRNPVEMAYALHAQQLRSCEEEIPDFEKAWNLQEDRRNGRSIPSACLGEWILQYREIASLGSQLRRVLSVFPAEQVHCIVFDDFIGDTRSCYVRLLQFLGVDDDGRMDFPPVNENAIYRWSWVNRLLKRPPVGLDRIWRAVKKRMGVRGTGLGSLVVRINSTVKKRAPLTPSMRRVLENAFEEEIRELEVILHRDFGHWRTAPVQKKRPG